MAGRKPTPTLQDVARRAGVSTATVSRCLNEPEKVSHATRARVSEAVGALGYTPNFGARAMAAQRTNTIAAVIPTMENAIFARGLQAFQEELDANGFTLLVASSSYRPELEERQIRTLLARGADGFLLIGHERGPAIYRLLEARNVPAQVVWTFDTARPRPAIGFDNRLAMRNLAREVLRRGHRRLALISAHIPSNDRAAARRDGLWEALHEVGRGPEHLTVLETSYGIRQGARAFAQIMDRNPRPTAVFGGNDVLAVGALGQAREMGLDVPGEVSILGFDDIELAQVAYPSLTTVHVPHREMGRRAARSLIDHLRNGLPLVSRELPTELRLRASLGEVPGPAAEVN